MPFSKHILSFARMPRPLGRGWSAFAKGFGPTEMARRALRLVPPKF